MGFSCSAREKAGVVHGRWWGGACHSSLMVGCTLLISVLNFGRVHILVLRFLLRSCKNMPHVLEQGVVVFPFGKQILVSVSLIAGIILAVPRAEGCVCVCVCVRSSLGVCKSWVGRTLNTGHTVPSLPSFVTAGLPKVGELWSFRRTASIQPWNSREVTFGLNVVKANL